MRLEADLGMAHRAIAGDAAHLRCFNMKIDCHPVAQSSFDYWRSTGLLSGSRLSLFRSGAAAQTTISPALADPQRG